MNRRQFVLAGSAALAGCGRANRDALRVFCYAGNHEAAMRAAFVPAFEAAIGATVSLAPGWWDGVPKLKAAPPDDPPFDLMISDATQGFPAAKDGLFATIDPALVPNVAALAPAALDHWIWTDRFGVPYPDSVMTLAFHTDRADAAPARWADLLRPDLAGKIGLYNALYMSFYTFAAVWADADGKPGTAHERVKTDPDGVLRFAREHRQRVKLWWATSTDMLLSLTNGAVAAGNMHSPEYLAALREKPELAAAVPELDRAFVQVFWSIPAGSKRKELAQRAIDVLFSPEVQRGFTRFGMATAVPTVAAEVAAADPLWKSLYPHSPEQFARVRYYPYDAYVQHGPALADAWERTVLRAG